MKNKISLSVFIKSVEYVLEALSKLEWLTGYSIDELLEKFTAGWTLEPPKKPQTVSDLLREFEERKE